MSSKSDYLDSAILDYTLNGRKCPHCGNWLQPPLKIEDGESMFVCECQALDMSPFDDICPDCEGSGQTGSPGLSSAGVPHDCDTCEGTGQVKTDLDTQTLEDVERLFDDG